MKARGLKAVVCSLFAAVMPACLGDFLKSFSPASRKARIELNAILLLKNEWLELPSQILHVYVSLLAKLKGET